MPRPALQIYGRAQAGPRQQLLLQAQWAFPSDRAWAPLGYFFWNKQVPAKTDPQQPVLWTSDAASCVILVLSCGNGHGAIGHTTETDSVEVVVRAAEQMCGTMGMQRETLIFAGGEQITAPHRADIVAQTRGLAPTVSWKIDPDESDTAWPYSAAVYLPTRDTLLLFDEIRDPDLPQNMLTSNQFSDPVKFDGHPFDVRGKKK
jgi:hypothetical protein